MSPRSPRREFATSIHDGEGKTDLVLSTLIGSQCAAAAAEAAAAQERMNERVEWDGTRCIRSALAVVAEPPAVVVHVRARHSKRRR